MKIQRGTILDLRELNSLDRKCFSEDESWRLLRLAGTLLRPTSVCVKAVEAGAIVGYAAGYHRRRVAADWIDTICVLPEFRQRGVARELLRACERQLKASRIRLTVHASNGAAIRLYETEGYGRREVLPAHYPDGGNAVVMEKTRNRD